MRSFIVYASSSLDQTKVKKGAQHTNEYKRTENALNLFFGFIFEPIKIRERMETNEKIIPRSQHKNMFLCVLVFCVCSLFVVWSESCTCLNKITKYSILMANLENIEEKNNQKLKKKKKKKKMMMVKKNSQINCYTEKRWNCILHWKRIFTHTFV